MESFIKAIDSIPPETIELLLTVIITSPALQALKKKLNIDSGAIMFWLSSAVAFAVPLIASITYLNISDPRIIALQGVIQAFTQTSFYYALVKPLYKRLETSRANKEYAERYRKEVLETAIVPAGGLPIEAEPVGKPEAETPIAPTVTEDFN